MKNIQFVVKDTIDNRNVIKHISERPMPFVVQVKQGTGTRSDQQNRYYHGVVVRIIANECGYDTETVHTYLRNMFLLVKKESFCGHEIAISRSTTGLTTAEFEDYTKQIREWASEKLGINIPLPNEPSPQYVY